MTAGTIDVIVAKGSLALFSEYKRLLNIHLLVYIKKLPKPKYLWFLSNYKRLAFQNAPITLSKGFVNLHIKI